MKSRLYTATFYAFLAASLYAVNVPFSKLLLKSVAPSVMAALLYLGAGIGLFLISFPSRLFKKETKSEPITKKELPYVVLMVLLDIIAPILLMFGLLYSSAANVSLINNFEIVATSVIALVIFKETVSKKLWTAIALVIVASLILTFEKTAIFEFNIGSLFVFGACLCWGFENNCTKMLSHKSTTQIVIIKGIFSGIGSLIVAFISKEPLPSLSMLLLVLLLGFISYGLSINFYIKAQKDLGAAKTSAYYSVAPFFGAFFGMVVLGERPAFQFYIAFLIMIAATIIMIRDTIKE